MAAPLINTCAMQNNMSNSNYSNMNNNYNYNMNSNFFNTKNLKQMNFKTYTNNYNNMNNNYNNNMNSNYFNPQNLKQMNYKTNTNNYNNMNNNYNNNMNNNYNNMNNNYNNNINNNFFNTKNLKQMNFNTYTNNYNNMNNNYNNMNNNYNNNMNSNYFNPQNLKQMNYKTDANNYNNKMKNNYFNPQNLKQMNLKANRNKKNSENINPNIEINLNENEIKNEIVKYEKKAKENYEKIENIKNQVIGLVNNLENATEKDQKTINSLNQLILELETVVYKVREEFFKNTLYKSTEEIMLLRTNLISALSYLKNSLANIKQIIMNYTIIVEANNAIKNYDAYKMYDDDLEYIKGKILNIYIENIKYNKSISEFKKDAGTSFLESNDELAKKIIKQSKEIKDTLTQCMNKASEFLDKNMDTKNGKISQAIQKRKNSKENNEKIKKAYIKQLVYIKRKLV